MKCNKLHTNIPCTHITVRHVNTSVSVLSRLPERADELSVAEFVVSGGGRGPEDVSGRGVRRNPSVHGSAQRERGATRPGYSTRVPHYHHTAGGPGGCARGTGMICLSVIT